MVRSEGCIYPGPSVHFPHNLVKHLQPPLFWGFKRSEIDVCARRELRIERMVCGMVYLALQFWCRICTPDTESSAVPSSARRTKPHLWLKNKQKCVAIREELCTAGMINNMHISIHSMHLSASHKDCCRSVFSLHFLLYPWYQLW